MLRKLTATYWRTIGETFKKINKRATTITLPARSLTTSLTSAAHTKTHFLNPSLATHAGLPFSLKQIMRGLSTQTRIRVRHTDCQGHADYSNGFGRIIEEELHAVLRKVGIQSSEINLHADGVYDKHKTKNTRYFMPKLLHTEYKAEMFTGEEIKSTVVIVGMNAEAGQIYLSTQLKKSAGGTASTGYYVLQKYENGRISPLSDKEEENIKTQLQTAYTASTNSYNLPIQTSPNQVIGKEITLTDDECRIQKDQTGHNGVIEPIEIFEILHTYCYEKGLMEDTNEGFETKKGKPVMSASDVTIYKDLREDDKYRAYVYVEQNSKGESFEKSRYSWVGTITDEAGNIVAIARCNHALLDMHSKPVKNADQKFLDRLTHYAIPQNQGYQNLLDKGALPKTKNLKLEMTDEIATITINVQDKPQNMITAGLLSELELALHVATLPQQKALILQSGRDGMFVVGADVTEFAHATSEDQIISFSARAQKAYNQLANSQIPTISITNGYTLGGGEELALATNYRIGTPDTKLGQVEVLLGVFPAFDGCQRLTNLVGPVEAARQIVSGEMFNATQAYKNGLLDAIVKTKKDINDFVKKVIDGQIPPKPKAQLSLSKDDEASLVRLKEMADEILLKQLATLEKLLLSESITPEEASNIRKWLIGVNNARLAALDVIIAQLKTDQPAEKSKIERETFAKLALTPEAKFATQFWLLDKKKYSREHEIVNKELLPNLFYIPEIIKSQATPVEKLESFLTKPLRR